MFFLYLVSGLMVTSLMTPSDHSPCLPQLQHFLFFWGGEVQNPNDVPETLTSPSGFTLTA